MKFKVIMNIVLLFDLKLGDLAMSKLRETNCSNIVYGKFCKWLQYKQQNLH